MMKNLLFMSLLISLAFSGEAVSACGPAFDGAWKYEGVESNQKETSLFVNNSKNRTLYFDTHTYLLDWIPSMRTYSEKRIVHLENSKQRKNLSAKRVNKTTCDLRFGRSYIHTDVYRAAGKRQQATSARLTLTSANRIRMCWNQKQHDFGQCHVLRLHSR